MRVLFLTYNFIPPSKPGGLRAWQIGRYLVDAGHHVTVVTCATNYMVGGQREAMRGIPPDETGRLKVIEVQTPIKNHRRSKGHRILHDIIFALKQFRVAFASAGNVDLVLSASPPILTPMMACVLSFYYKIPHIFEVRDILSAGLVAGGIIRSKMFVTLIDVLEKFCFRCSRGLVAVTPGIRRLMIKKGISDDKIIVITNGVEDELYAVMPQKATACKHWALADGVFKVVFTGTLSSFSNVQLLLESARLLATENVVFLIAGEGQKRAAYENFCCLNGLEKVRFLGAIARNQIPSLCTAADVCVHMFKEGEFWDIFFSNKMFDYMGAGRPVVYSGGGDSAALVRSAKGGLVVQAENPKALADGILFFLNSPGKKQTMGENARKYVFEHYSRKQLMSRMVCYLESFAINP